MKNFIKLSIGIWALFVSLLCLSSCNDDDSKMSTSAPVINSVAASADEDGVPSDLSPVEIGFANNIYIIQGSGFATVQKVYFNDVEAAFNPNFVNDNVIFATININTPYADSSNELRIVTKYGTAVYPFTVAPPAPVFTSYNPVNANEGDTVTIYGDFFLDPQVTFGTTAATVLSSTLTQIQVQVPAGAQYTYPTVTTISGSTTATDAVGTSIFDDTAASFVENYIGPWDGSGFVANTSIKVQGESSIEANFTGYTGFKIPMYATPVPSAPYSGIRVWFKSTKETGKFKIVLNNNYGAGKEVSFTSNWTYVVVPFSELGGAPAEINEIVFQEFNNDSGDKIYIDNIGFTLQ